MTGERWMRPSEVFARRVRETRKARGLSQTELAARMTERGRPLSRPALQQLETGNRGVSLDEALALAMCLDAAPANLLSPAADALLALTDNCAVDGEALRTWFATGDALVGAAWPATPGADDRAALDVILSETLSSQAVAFVDALRAKDKSGIKTLYRAMGEAVDRHRAALRAIDTGEHVPPPPGVPQQRKRASDGE